MNVAIVEMANQFSLESSRNSTSEVTVGRPHPVELLNSVAAESAAATDVGDKEFCCLRRLK